MNDFFANWYELIAYFDGFSNFMYDNGFYVSVGFCMVLIPVVLLTLYYYVVNSRRFNRWWHWLLLVLIICAINFIIGFVIPYNGAANFYGDTDYVDFPVVSCCLGFSFVNILWCFVVSFVWSMIIKWGSSQCRRCPF